MVSGVYLTGESFNPIRRLLGLRLPIEKAPVILFRGLGKGRFAERECVLNRQGEPLTDLPPDSPPTPHPSATEPYFTDWDADGDLDVVIGNYFGEILLIRNEGSRERPRYGVRGELLEHGGRPIRVPGGLAGPEVADWDGDGLPDLLSGSGDGAVFLFRNQGKRGEPRLAEGVAIIPKGAYKDFLQPGQEPHRSEYSRIHATDFNGDGKLDILLGDMQRILRFRSDLSDEERESVDTLIRERREAVAERDRLFKDSAGAILSLGEKAEQTGSEFEKQQNLIAKRIDDLEAKLAAFADEDERHGFVWVFLRK